MNNVAGMYGENVFNESVMEAMLPEAVFRKLKETIETMAPLSEEIAEPVANAMKEWAISKGATHYTHWFQPMTGCTAEKHDAFISPTADGKVIMEFSSKALIKGESDASSFPSGGLRATFEARGYTAWDPTSFAFVKDGSLYIPTAFCSYGGEVLDKKTPLLRSMDVLNREALRILALFGKTPARIISNVGAEQEYFLIDEKYYSKRKDLVVTGRTLFGAKPPKGQELDDHYYGNIKERIASYMKELDEELWKLGVPAKTKHNEVAPAQHELAPVYATTNIATDQNQLMMEYMKKIAKRHGLVCLLHEKPFAGVNGSGKHNNWSLSTSDGENLLKPGKNPIKNTQFLLFFAAVVKALDTYGELLRVSVASAGNDHRLGGNEAPPAIVSMFVGDEIESVLTAIAEGKNELSKIKSVLETKVETLPTLYKDTTDRNRTSPFAFTGNKFEFRMPGSAQSIAGTNIALNSSVAMILREFADRLEGTTDIETDARRLIRETVENHGRIIFNGNNYSEEWAAEAERRGLPNLKDTIDALPSYVKPEILDMLSSVGVFTKSEVQSRYEIHLEEYSKLINIEALTMLEMARKEIIPACITYCDTMLAAYERKASSSLSLPAENEKQLVCELASLTDTLIANTNKLDTVLGEVKDIEGLYENAKAYRDHVLSAMQEVRDAADKLETIVSSKYWPFPTYTELLFNI